MSIENSCPTKAAWTSRPTAGSSSSTRRRTSPALYMRPPSWRAFSWCGCMSTIGHSLFKGIGRISPIPIYQARVHGRPGRIARKWTHRSACARAESVAATLRPQDRRRTTGRIGPTVDVLCCPPSREKTSTRAWDCSRTLTWGYNRGKPVPSPLEARVAIHSLQ